MKIGILTGGGDAPGLNAVIRAVTLAALKEGYEVVGIKNGWKGLIEADTIPLDYQKVYDIIHEGGTILGTSRTNPAKIEGGYERILENVKKLGIDVIVAIGGEDTQSVSAKLVELGVNVIGVPKTIDNDVVGTDQTFGFDTAVNIVVEAIDRLRTTARSHQRVMVVEVMGRHAGWIALVSGIAGGADAILLPEQKFSVEEVCNAIRRAREKGKPYNIIVVAEGAEPSDIDLAAIRKREKDAFGHVRLGGIGYILEEEIKKRTGLGARAVVLGHLQRGGPPSAFDRYLCTRFGLKVIELIKAKKFGRMVALRGTEIVDVPLTEVGGKTRTVPESLINEFKPVLP